MKRTMIASLAVSAALLASATGAFAATGGSADKSKDLTLTPVPYASVGSDNGNLTLTAVSVFIPGDVDGTIVALSDKEMTVKTDLGVTVRVPLDQFAKLDGFSDLHLAVGTKVSVKNTDVKEGTAVPAGDLKESADLGLALTVAPVQPDLQAIASESTFMTGQVKEVGPLPGQHLPKNATTAPAAKADLSGQPLKIDPQAGSQTLTTKPGTAAATQAKIGDLMFKATEITANGKTLSL